MRLICTDNDYLLIEGILSSIIQLVLTTELIIPRSFNKKLCVLKINSIINNITKKKHHFAYLISEGINIFLYDCRSFFVF